MTNAKGRFLRPASLGGLRKATQLNDALESLNAPEDRVPRPNTLAEFAGLIGTMTRAGYLVALNEFQYFNRAHLQPFCLSLQAEIDTLSADADQVPGGLIVLGSVQMEMMALLEDRSAPLFNRICRNMSGR